jgi:hypothetical protein
MTKSRATAPSCGSALPMNALVRSSVCVYVGVGLHLVLCSLNCQLLFPTFLTTPPPLSCRAQERSSLSARFIVCSCEYHGLVHKPLHLLLHVRMQQQQLTSHRDARALSWLSLCI